MNCEAVLQIFGWVKAEELRAGDVSKTAEGSLKIAKVQGDPRTEEVYNFQVSENHTYSVTERGIVVHNRGYTVLPGEGLRAIAKKNKISVEVLLELNPHLNEDSILHPGDRVVISAHGNRADRSLSAKSSNVFEKYGDDKHVGKTVERFREALRSGEFGKAERIASSFSHDSKLSREVVPPSGLRHKGHLNWYVWE